MDSQSPVGRGGPRMRGGPSAMSTQTMVSRRNKRRVAKTTMKVSKGPATSTNRLTSTNLPEAPPVQQSRHSRSSSVASTPSSPRSEFDGCSVPSSDAGFELDEDIPPINPPPDFERPDFVHTMPSKRIRISPFDSWYPLRERFLESLFVLDGRGGESQLPCRLCSRPLSFDGGPATARRCLSCAHAPLFCIPCLVKQHEMLPSHRIQLWMDGHWMADSLHRHGLCLFLGHGGRPCGALSHSRTLTFLDANGFHTINVNFCGCSTNLEGRLEYRQLLASMLFPATTEAPSTVFTFSLLDQLVALTARGRTSTYDYHEALRMLTDNCNLNGITKRYVELTIAVRRYRYLLMLKRAGAAHSPNGIADLRLGDLAIECPAAPLKGKNLPPDADVLHADKPHLRARYIALDANFRLKRKTRKRGKGDDGLVHGAAYFGDPDLFSQESERARNQKKTVNKSSCESSFAAIERADSRINKGYDVTGVVAAIDARHGFLLTNGVIDLQRGEAYLNTDFVFLSSLQHLEADLVYVSYDIACQWSVHLLSRCKEFESLLADGVEGVTLVFAIPKFHLPAHGFICWSRYSLNYIPGSARNDGEGIERFWSTSNQVATSTREMYKGSRHDLLEERWGSANYRKLVELGSSLSHKLKVAVEGRNRHVKELEEFSTAFDPAFVDQWKKDIEAYHNDPINYPDPYQTLTQECTMVDIQKEIRTEEEKEYANADTEQGVSEVDFLASGLKIEELQRSLRLDIAAKTRPSKTDLAAFERRRLNIGRCIFAYLNHQARFMPDAAAYRISVHAKHPESTPIFAPPHEADAEDDQGSNLGSDDDNEENVDQQIRPDDAMANPLGIKAEDLHLYLPSHASSILRNFATPQLMEKEKRLRLARLESHLIELRRLLRIKTSVYFHKKANSVGQKAGTRSTTLLAKYTAKIVRVADRYRDEWSSMARLDREGTWRNRLQKLVGSDIRGVHQNADEAFTSAGPGTREVWGEAAREISWIWKVPRLGSCSAVSTSETSTEEESSEQDVDQILRAEWAKTYARANRFLEEVELILEEMRRVQRYFIWRAAWWRERENVGRADVHPLIASGRAAYALKQAKITERLRSKFAGLWHHQLRQCGFPVTEIDV